MDLIALLVGVAVGLVCGYFARPKIDKLLAKDGGGPGEEKKKKRPKDGGGPGEE